MDSAQSFITSSWTFYLQADDGKIVIFQVVAFFIEIRMFNSAPSSHRKDYRVLSEGFTSAGISLALGAV